MDVLTAAVYDVLTTDAELAALLASYNGLPAVFTVDPAPGDAVLPYIVTAGNVADSGWDTKTGLGRHVFRDVRCYAAADGSAVTVEAIAERVRELFHRQPLVVSGFGVLVAICSGPVASDEGAAYGRIVTCQWKMEQVED